VEANKPRYLWNCGVRSGVWDKRDIAVAGPVLGAPYAAMVLEKLIALGARAVVVLGWCGSLQSHLPSGSLVLPLAALAGDGTSPHYLLNGSHPEPHPALRGRLAQVLLASLDDAIPFDAGLVWTTDAFYRETADAVRHYQGQGVLAVDLEMAALFAVGRFRGAAVAGLLAVSDALFDLTWLPGQRSGRLRQAREAAARAALAALTAWEVDDA
jgi:uridine phosphorylase